MKKIKKIGTSLLLALVPAGTMSLIIGVVMSCKAKTTAPAVIEPESETERTAEITTNFTYEQSSLVEVKYTFNFNGIFTTEWSVDDIIENQPSAKLIYSKDLTTKSYESNVLINKLANNAFTISLECTATTDEPSMCNILDGSKLIVKDLTFKNGSKTYVCKKEYSVTMKASLAYFVDESSDIDTTYWSLYQNYTTTYSGGWINLIILNPASALNGVQAAIGYDESQFLELDQLTVDPNQTKFQMGLEIWFELKFKTMGEMYKTSDSIQIQLKDNDGKTIYSKTKDENPIVKFYINQRKE